MPISTIIDSPAALYALMITTDTADLQQSYVQTASIDMSTYTYPSTSIAGSDTPLHLYDFTGIYDGQGYTITIGDVVGYTGLFDTVAPQTGVPLSGIIKNVNVIYKNPINITLDNTVNNDVWGGLVGAMVVSTISNCSVTNNTSITIISPYSAPVGLLCGFMGQNSSISNSKLSVNGSIVFQGSANTNIGLLCGECADSDIVNCSVTSSSGTYDISMTSDLGSALGLVCGICAANILSVPIKRASLVNNTVSLNNNGTITLDTVNPDNTVYRGAICGSVIGDTTPDTTYQTIVDKCFVNITNNQTLIGLFDNFFVHVDGSPTLTNCQFLYRTTVVNSSRTITITPTPPSDTPVTYVDNYSGLYALVSGNYYIPNTTGTLVIGQQSLSLESQTSPGAILINGVQYLVGSSYSSANLLSSYTISIKGVGSMYFGLIVIPFSKNGTSNAECVCQINSCSTNPQTGVTADSRITNTVQDKTIRMNIDREFATNAVIYPKFKTYSDYINYLQGALRH